MFNFNYIFCKHKEKVYIKEEDNASDYNERGLWQEQRQAERDIIAMVTSLTNDDLKNTEEGRYTLQDKKFFTQEQVVLGTLIRRENGEFFKVLEGKDNKDHADFYVYYTRRIKNDN